MLLLGSLFFGSSLLLLFSIGCFSSFCTRSYATPYSATTFLFGTAQHDQRDIILLLPVVAGKGGKFAAQIIDERGPAWMVTKQLLQVWQAEHSVFRIMRLDQAIAVKQDTVARLHSLLVFLIAGPRQHPKRQAGCLELGNSISSAPIGPVVPGVRIAQASAVRIEDAVEAGHEHTGGNG